MKVLKIRQTLVVEYAIPLLPDDEITDKDLSDLADGLNREAHNQLDDILRLVGGVLVDTIAETSVVEA